MRLNALESLLYNARWAVLAAEFLAAKDSPDRLKPFVNTVLAEPWHQQGDEVDETGLAARTEPFGLNKISAEVLAITVGADVQDDRIEVSYLGWSRDGAVYVLAHQVAWDPVTANEVWTDFDDLLKQRWHHPHGETIGVDAAIVDAGDGGIYDVVMRFAAARAARRVWAGKGVPGFARAAFQLSARLKSCGSQRLYLFGTDSVKSLLFQRFKRGQTIRFSESLDASYFEQLCSERLITKFMHGRPERRFERIVSKRAEALDCIVMAYAARQGLALNLDAREATLKLAPQSTAPARVTRSRWMDRLT